MITEGEAAIPLETTRRAFGNQEKSKQRSAIGWFTITGTEFGNSAFILYGWQKVVHSFVSILKYVTSIFHVSLHLNRQCSYRKSTMPNRAIWKFIWGKKSCAKSFLIFVIISGESRQKRQQKSQSHINYVKPDCRDWIGFLVNFAKILIGSISVYYHANWCCLTTAFSRYQMHPYTPAFIA